MIFFNQKSLNNNPNETLLGLLEFLDSPHGPLDFLSIRRSYTTYSLACFLGMLLAKQQERGKFEAPSRSDQRRPLLS